MRLMGAAGLLVLALFRHPADAQPPAPSAEPVMVMTGHPRLFLRPARLRLLRRERERESVRWQQLDGYLSKDAPMPEGGFANALDYQISGNRALGRRAVAWALASATDLRQLALVFDWCQDLLDPGDRRELIARIQKRMMETEADDGIPAARSRALAAVALFDELPEVPNRELNRLVHVWWQGKIAAALGQGRDAVPRRDAYALWEFLHAIRDNTRLDLRESAARFFEEYPIEHLMSNYPEAFPGRQNDYRIGAMLKSGEPDLERAALSRAAELSMVAYDNNAENSQYLQGWLMHDSFMLRDIFGAPYEFLWANPYQPGLPYEHVPLVYHNADFGRLFVRSSWDDTADWFGFFDGAAQFFHKGKRADVDLSQAGGPVVLGSAVISWGRPAPNLRLMLGPEQHTVIFAGLAPSHAYRVEIAGQKTTPYATDRSGLLVIEAPGGKEVDIRVRKVAGAQ